MEPDDDAARTREFSEALLQILKWTQKSLRFPTATPSFELLVVLGASPESQLCYDDLESQTRRSHRAMQYVVHDMRTMGLVEVRSGSDDRRRRVIRLSPSGQKLYREYRDRVLSEMVRLSDPAPSRRSLGHAEETELSLGTAVIGETSEPHLKVRRA